MKIENARKDLKAAEKGGEHLNSTFDDLPEYALLPGDPNRIKMMMEQWDAGAKEFEMPRAFRSAIGTYKNVPISAFSTGIGGPSAEGVITNSAQNGVNTFIRVGTTGAIQPQIKIGDIIINDSNVRMDGTSDQYVRSAYPSAASFEVTMALVEACEQLGFEYHVGVGCTVSSFFAGQYRTSYDGYRPSWIDDEFKNMQQANVLNFEMEGATLLTLSRIFGLRAGMCASVVAHRLTGEWDEDNVGTEKACLVGAEAVRILTSWDNIRKDAGKKFFFPGLLR